MKKSTKSIVLIALIVIMAFLLFACKPKGGVPQVDDLGPTTPLTSVNKNQLLRKISNGMLLGEDNLKASEETYVSTTYTVLTGNINYTVTYQANYAKRRQNSEIYAKIFDNNSNSNRILIYYNKNNLFIQSQGEKHSVADFGSTNMFDLFFEMVTMLDMSGTLIGQTMSDLFNPDNVTGNLSPLIDQSRMTHIRVTETSESIEMTDVNLNYGQIKIKVNDMIKSTLGKFERKFDLLSLKYLGLRISEVAAIEIATMTGDCINVRLNNQAVETVIFKASGNVDDGINTFLVEMEVVAREGKGKIQVDPGDDPYTNTYPEMLMGRFHYSGTLYVPFFDMTYDATLRTILSSTDNTVNQVLFTINSVNEEMGGLFYKDQMLYVDVSGMCRQLNGAIELEKLNLPKVKFDGINLSQEITLLFNKLQKIIKSFNEDDEFGENEELLRLVLDNIRSDEKTNTISIDITKRLIEQLYGEDIDLLELIAGKLGVDRALIAQVLGDNALQNTVLVFSYNVENGDIGLDLYDDDMLVFQLRLSKKDPLPGDTLKYPDSFNPDAFYWLEIPDNTILSIDGTLSMQQVSKVQFDELFGALFGDITGLNTPYTLRSDEILNFSLDVMQVYSYYQNAADQTERHIEQVMKFEIFKKGVLQLGVYSSSDPNYLLVEFNVPVGPSGSDRDGIPYKQSALRYRIARQKVKDAFNELLGDDNIFVMENIMDVLSRLLRSIRDSKSMQLRFINSSLAFNLVSDSVNEIIGIDNLNALLQARVRFAVTAEEYLDIRKNESLFVTPDVRPLVNQTFESIYKTQWAEFAYAYFGDNLMRLKLTYLPDSVRIVSGKYFYQPRAKLLDTVASYYVTIQDSANGIKIAQSVLDPETPMNKGAALSVDHPLSIDPSRSAGLPGRMPVLYDDGTFGDVEYIIDGFDISNITISGMPKAEFWLIIGRGSVTELRFYIAVEVLCRIVIPLNEVIKGETVPMISDRGEPVVAEITIDPYSYAIRKAENPLWSPLPSNLILRFESPTGGEGDIVPVADIAWDFRFSNVQYNGGIFFSHASYNSLSIALKLNVKSKIVSYLRFVDIANASLPIDQRPLTEAIGQYTVDVLQTSSYTFPTGSTASQELRLYFEDGSYRIIGSRDHAPDDLNYFNSYLPLLLQWKHARVEESAIKLEGTKAPLGSDIDINTTVIGGEGFSIGVQTIALKVLMPSRAEASIGNAGNIFAITGYEKFADGSYNFEAPIEAIVTYTNASFSAAQPLGTFFAFNPYNQMPLPDKVYLEVFQGGETRRQRKGYEVQWQESDVLEARHTYDGAGNIIYTDYILRHVSTDEKLLLVTGIIGDGRHTIEVKMIINNLDAFYQDITFEGMDTNVTQKSIDPYLAYSLPSYFTLMLKNGSEIHVQNVEWYIELKPGQEWMLQLDGRSYHWIYGYLATLDDNLIPEGFGKPTEDDLDYFRLLIEKGEIPIDNRYVFSHAGGTFGLRSYVKATDTVIAQEIALTLTAIPRTVLLTDAENGYAKLDIHNASGSQPVELYILDTYQAESTAMLERLIYLQKYNDEYDRTVRRINYLVADFRKEYRELDGMAIYALAYDEYAFISTQTERNLLTNHYDSMYGANPNATIEELKFLALQSYMSDKNAEINKAKVGVYFGDNPETSTNKYLLNVRWTNLAEIIAILEDSEGAALGVVLEGYLGYGQINQQKIKIPFKITRREVTSFNFNRLVSNDSELLTADYRYVYIADAEQAVSLINTVANDVMMDNDIPQHQKSKTIFTRVFNISSENDKLIMEEVEQSIQRPDEEERYALILQEILLRRSENYRTVFIYLNKPMGLTEDDGSGNRIFLAPSEYFFEVLSQVSLEFNNDRSTAGYFAPRFVFGAGETAALRKADFDRRLLLPSTVEIDPVTGYEYAVVDILLTHLSAGSCTYPVTVRFRAVVDSKDVIDGYPSESEIEPFDENGGLRFPNGYKLPERITINYRHSKAVTFGNINKWYLDESTAIDTIPVTQINLLNPPILDLSIQLPCGQGEFTYHISFPQKYIGKTRYDAVVEDANFRALNIHDGIIEINNLYEIYDSGKAVGFDISKLPRYINPYTYEFGAVQFDMAGEIVDTYFTVTHNNSYLVEWRLTDEWATGRRIDHNGTTVLENGELVTKPVLFATASLPSYYYMDNGHPVELKQQIELYIKVKPLANPLIDYSGLVEYSDNNYINFDPYDDPNGYGGYLILPKDLTVYFNNNLVDSHTFDAGAALTYYLLMSDAQDISRAFLFDSLMERSATTPDEKTTFLKILLNRIIATYAERMDVTPAKATEQLYSDAFNAVLESGSLPLTEREKQRRFLVDFMSGLLSAHYGFSDAAAWRKLLQTAPTESEKLAKIAAYTKAVQTMDEAGLLRDMVVLIAGYNAFVSLNAAEKADIADQYLSTLDTAKRAEIIEILARKDLFPSERALALENINQQGGIPNETARNAEILVRVLAMVSVNNRLDIFRIAVQDGSFCKTVALATGFSEEDASKAILLFELIKAQTRNDYLTALSVAILSCVNHWQGSDDTEAFMWREHMSAVIKSGELSALSALVDTYMSVSSSMSVSRTKQIVFNQLINVYGFDDADTGRYFLESGSEVAARIMRTACDRALTQLQLWQIRKAKAEAWQAITAALTSDGILSRVLAGDSDAENTGRIDTVPVRSLAYERLRLSSYLPIFQARLTALEAEATDPIQEYRQASIFRNLYEASTLSEKVILAELLMASFHAVTDTRQSVTSISYTQAGHSILEIKSSILQLILYLPDGQSIDITLNIFSREIREVLVPNTFTNESGGETVSSQTNIPNIYYIDPYNSETFRLPSSAEFVFETGYNLVLDIDEWLDYDEDTFYTRSSGSQKKIFYYNLSQNSYRGGRYVLTSYLTYGIGAAAERQMFQIQVIVLNRTLKKQYSEKFNFDNPIAGRSMDIPAMLTNDMFVESDVYYKNFIPAEYFYSNFGTPVVPQIDWSKTSYNPYGLSDSDILVTGGFDINVQGYLYYENNLLTKTYQQIWQTLYEEVGAVTKPIAWERFFETMLSGERVVRTVFAGEAAVQIKALDNQIFDELYIRTYKEACLEAEPNLLSQIENVMKTLRNNNPGLIPDDESELWYVVFYKDLEAKAKSTTLSELEEEVWDYLYAAYVAEEIKSIGELRAKKWDELFEMEVWQGAQKQTALSYLDQAYSVYRNFMLVTAWETLERSARSNEAAVMTELVESLRQLYGSVEQAKIRGWDFLRNDDRVRGITGESASVNVTAEKWDYAEIRNLANELIDEITFNAFTKTSNDDTFKLRFEILNTLLIERLNETLESTVLSYYEEYRDDALTVLEEELMRLALSELEEIDAANAGLSGAARNLKNWNDLYAKRIAEAVSPIDDTRAAFEAAGITEPFLRDTYVWASLIEGAGEWLDDLIAIYADIEGSGVAEGERPHYAVEAYREFRIERLTSDMNVSYGEAYTLRSLNAWNTVATSPISFGETAENISFILEKDVLQQAWLALESYSTPQEVTTMRTFLNYAAYGVLQYSRGWASYYAYLTDPARKGLMDDLKLYYYGFDSVNGRYSGYEAVYDYILERPESVGETAAGLSALLADLNVLLQNPVPERTVVEIIRRFISYRPETAEIYQGFVNALKRDAWIYLLERKLNHPDLVALLPQDTLKSDAWLIYAESRQRIAEEDLSAIGNLFLDIAAERLDWQKRDAVDALLSLYEGTSEETVINDIIQSFDADEIKTILWSRLYAGSSAAEMLSMDSTLNQALREGRVPGAGAEAISWDRLLDKNETSPERKLLMQTMFEIYVKARAWESYIALKYDESTEYEDGLLDDRISVRKKSRVWDELYDEADGERQAVMDVIFLSIGLINEIERRAASLDALAAMFPEESDLIYLRVQAVVLEYEDAEAIQQIKAAEWDDYYNAANYQRKQQLDAVLAKYASILILAARKAAALDDEDFHAIIGEAESQALSARLQSRFDELLDILIWGEVYDGIVLDGTHAAELSQCYDDLYDRYLHMYGFTDASLLKKLAVQELRERHRKASDDYFDAMLSDALTPYYAEFRAVCWDRYYAHNELHNEERAALMAEILRSSVVSIMDTLKVNALDSLFSALWGEASARINDVKSGLTDTLKKKALWAMLFGQELAALEDMLNDILPINDNNLTLKDTVWTDMIAHLTEMEIYYTQLLVIKEQTAEDNPALNQDDQDALSWDNLYSIAMPALLAIMDGALQEYGLFAEDSKHLALRDIEARFHGDKQCLDTMLTIKYLIVGETTQLGEAELNALAFDRVYDLHPDIGDRITAEYVNKIKQDSLNALIAANQDNALLVALISEMYALELYYHNNDEESAAATCWDRFVYMTHGIKETLASVDPRYSEDELKAFSIDFIMNLLGGDERAVLRNALDGIHLSYPQVQLDAMVYDIIYSESIPAEKEALTRLYDAAALLGGIPMEIKSAALAAYIEEKGRAATVSLHPSFNTLSGAEKTALFAQLQGARLSDTLLAYTLDLAEMNWNERRTDTEYGRTNIFWDLDVLTEGGDIAKIYIGNAYKAFDNAESELNYRINVFEIDNFLYKNRQIIIDKLDFYGELNVYSGEEVIDTVHYYNELVIDPLSPRIPVKAAAYGTITGVPRDIEIDGQMYSYIGMVDISFENRIYDFLYDEEGIPGEDMTAHVSPGLGEGVQNITVNVHYLDRRPVMYYVNSPDYSTEQVDDILNLYPLGIRPDDHKVITLDPLNDDIYDTSAKRYVLPGSLVVMFTDAYVDGSAIATLFMNGVFNNRLDISGISWNMLGHAVTLAGLDPSNISIDKYTVDGREVVSTPQMGWDFWKIKLTVLKKEADRALKVNLQGQGGVILATGSGGVLTAANKIDPYNVMTSFPDHVRVEFADGSESKLLTNITWQFAEGRGLEYLTLPEVITGSIGESAMYITAGFICVSEVIWINFPIQKRHIDISVEGTDEVRYLEGGTIYLVKGVDLWMQLNRYSSLFYNFADYGSTPDWSEVPLEFLVNDVSQISTAEVGTYTVRGRLGPINDPNIYFTIVVIDPKLYAVDADGHLNNKVYYDRLSVAVNSFGMLIKGKESEEGFLSDSLVQLAVTDAGGNIFIGYNEFEIVDRYWDIANQKVVFTCRYTFLDENDDIERLAGGPNGVQQLFFTVNLPLDTYLYTAIDDSMVINTGNTDGTNILKLTLGQSLKMSDLPKAIMNPGKPNEFQVPLIWDLTSINVNKAGTYNLYGYYKEYTSSYQSKSKHLTVVIDKVDVSAQITSLYPLTQTYTGLYIEVVPVLPNVLREQGNYAQLRLAREIIVEYLTEEKYLMGAYGEFSTLPYKDAGIYYVRITVNDYNTVGQQTYRLVINPIEINPRDIIFEYGSGALDFPVSIPNWPESSAEKNRMYYTQFRLYANSHLGANVSVRARAAAYETLYAQVSMTGQELLTNRYQATLNNLFPEYETVDETEKTAMRLAAKALVWDSVTPYGVDDYRLVPGWPSTDLEKQALFDAATQQIPPDGTDNEARAQAFDNLFEEVINLGKVVLQNRLDEILQTRFPNYNDATEALKTIMLVEAKAIVWSEIVPTGLAGHALVTNWPTTTAQIENRLDAEYDNLLNISLAGSEKELFIRNVKALAYDELYERIYTTAKLKLQDSLTGILQIYYPLYDTYGEEQRALILTEAKSMAWDAVIPGDTVTEKSYIYDGQDHMPVFKGMPQAKIVGWPQTEDEKNALLLYAKNENAGFTEQQARARAFDNLQQKIYSNIFVLQKMTDILNDVIAEYYPAYNDPLTAYTERQQLLVLAKAQAWDTRIVYGDTVEEIYYSYSYWYADMDNKGMVISTRPRAAGTYEITLIIDPLLNRNYRMRADAVVLATISIRRAAVSQSFLNEMVYQGTAIKPECPGLHDANGALPDGVTVTYTYLKDGRPVNSIRDVGEYIFTATVNGGNNYPSWTVDSQVITIVKKDLTIDLGTVESPYLENIKALNSGVTFTGIVGSDLPSMFGYLVCDSNVSNKHMVGDYPIQFIGFKYSFGDAKIYYLDAVNPADNVSAMNAVLFGNYNIHIINGTYIIKKANENAIILDGRAELDAHYDAMQEGESAVWYLSPGNYGDFVIDKNVGITIIGCYDVNAHFDDFADITDAHKRMMSIVEADSGHIVTAFDSIKVIRGALTLDIIKLDGKINSQSIFIDNRATAVELKRCALVHTEVFGEGGAAITQNASAISSAPSFKGLIRLDRTFIKGFTSAVFLNGAGSLEIVNSRFRSNRSGVTSVSSRIHIEGSAFEFTMGTALYLQMISFTVINSSFASNETAIKSLASNTYDLLLENMFTNNVKDIERI